MIVNLFTSFGYFDDERDNARVLANIFDSVKPGGTFVIDVAGKDIVARIFQPTGALEVPGAGLQIQRRQVIDGWCRMENEWLRRQGRSRALVPVPALAVFRA